MADTEQQEGFRRVLLKMSGEAFGGGSVGVDPDIVADLASQIANVAREGAQLAIVVGGGNFFRARSTPCKAMLRKRHAVRLMAQSGKPSPKVRCPTRAKNEA